MPTKMSQKEIEARRKANATRKAAVEQQQAQKAQEKKETVQKAASALSQGAKNLRSAGPTAQNAPAKKTTKNHLLQGAIQQQRKGYTAKEVGQKLPSSVKNVIDRTYTAQRNANIKRAEEAMKRATDRRSKIAASHQLRQAKHTLSLADKQLSQDDQNKILRAREQWEQGESLKRRGDTQRGNALQEAAHYAAETARAGGGYSGGESGQDYLLPEIGEGYQQLMTEEGKRTLRTAKLYYRLGQQGGSRELMDAAHELANAARGNTANYSRAALERQWANIPTAQRYDGNDRPVYTPSLLEARAQESFLPAVADQTAGSLLSLLETARTSTRNMARNSGNQKYQNAKTSYERLSRQAAQATDPEEKARLERAATQAKKVMEENKADDAVDPNSKGQELLRKAAQESENVLAGMQSKGGKLLAQAALSMANMAPSLLLSAVATPAAGLALMGAQAAGSKAGELGARGVSAQEALARGLVSGGIEGITEKIPLGSLMEIVKRGGGASFLKTIAKQAGIEATEESASYALNFLADKAARDPEAQFSLAELAENAAVGAISGGAFGGLGSLGAVVNRPTQTGGAGPRGQTAQAAAPMAEPAAQTKTAVQENPLSPARQIVQRPQQTAAKPEQLEVGSAHQATERTPVPAASRKRATAPASSGMATLERAGQTLGESGRKALQAAYDGRGDRAAYFQGFAQVYNQALTGRAAGEIPAPRGLTDAQVLAAYSAGQNDRAASLARAKEAVQYATAQGKDAGLVYDDYVHGALDKETAREINTVAKQLGLRVEMVETVAGGAANAELQNGVVRLEKGNPNPVRALFGHELTHRVQELAPESYRAFRDFVMADPVYLEEVQRKLQDYAAQGVKLTQEAAMDEITADYAGMLIEDQDLLGQFIQANKADQSLLQRLWQAVKDLAAKVTGRHKANLEDAAALLEQAVGQASAQAERLAKQGRKAETSGRPQFSLKEKKEIHSEVLDKVKKELKTVQDNGVLKHLTGEEFSKGGQSLVQQVAGYFDQMGGQVARKDFGTIRLSRRGIKDSMAHGIGRKKAAAFAAVPEVLQDGIIVDRQENWKGRSYDTYVFAGEVNIAGQPNAVGVVVIRRNGDSRFYLHEVTTIEKGDTATFKTGATAEAARLPGDAVPPLQSEATSDKPAHEARDIVAASDPTNRIPQNQENSKAAEGENSGKFSLKTADGYLSAKLQEENKLLRERVDYWKGQTKRSSQATTDRKAVAKAARRLVREYGADLEAAEIQGDLQGLYDAMAGDKGLTYTQARTQAEAIAQRLVASAVAKEDGMYQQYGDLRSYLRETTLTISEEGSHDISDFSAFRQRNFGRMKISKGSTNVDQVYQELSALWPEFFDETREITPADQLEHIAQVMDQVYAVTEANPFQGYTRQAIAGAANEIMEGFFDLPQTKATFADRQAGKLDRAKAQGRQRLAAEREKKNAQLEALRQENRQRVQTAIARERQRREKELDRLKSAYRARDASGRERRQVSQLRAKILRHTKALSKKLLSPNDQQHVPEGLRGAAARLLEAINLESPYTYDETGKRRKADGGSPTQRTQAFRQLRQAYRAIQQEGDAGLVIDPDLLDNLQEVEALGDVKLADMTPGQLTTVWNTIKAVEASISSANKLFGQARFETVLEAARGLEKDNAGRRDRGDYRGPVRAIDKLMNADMLTPESFFHRLGPTGEELFRMLRRAQDKHIQIMEEVQRSTQELVGKTDIRKLEKTVHRFSFGEKTLELTTGQIMSLRELMKRQQGAEHITVGGIRPEGVDKGIRRKAPAEAVKLTPEEIGEILDTLTEEEAQLADGLQQLMGGRLAKLGNEASLEVYGYEKFKEKNYFPIQVDSNQTKTDQVKDAAQATIAGRGFTKATRPHASNAVLVKDIFSVYADHVTDMATYRAWLGPMENLQRVFNFRFRDEAGQVTGTVKGLLRRIYGANGPAYWTKLTEDLNNGVHGTNDNPFGGLVGNYKASAIGANIRVFIQQPTSILRALDEIAPQDFVAGILKASPTTWKKVKQYAPIAVWKDWGYFDADTGRQMKSILFGDDSRLAKVNNALMAPAGAMDSLAWSHLWNSLEAETRRKHKNLAPGSEAFYQKVAQRFHQVIDHSQVVDGILQRSQIMRSADGVTKMATSFMAEPTKIYNMFTTAAYDLRKAQDPKVRNRARRKLARTTLALVASFAANAAAQSLVDALRDDDKDEEYWEKFFQAFTGLEGDEEGRSQKLLAMIGGNAGSALNPGTYVPFVKDIVSLVQGYDVGRMDMESISHVVGAVGYCLKAFRGEGKMTKQNALTVLLAEAARLVGVPVSNLKRDVLAAFDTWLVGTKNYKGQYAMARWLYQFTDNNKGIFLDIAYLAWRDGDEETYLQISQDLMDRMDTDGPAIEKAMKTRYAKQAEKDADFRLDEEKMERLGVLPSFGGEEEEKEASFDAGDLNASQYHSYSKQRAEQYRNLERSVTSSPAWAKLDGETRGKIVDTIWKYAGEYALEDQSGGRYAVDNSKLKKIRAAEEAGMDVASYVIALTAAGQAEGTKTVDGDTIKNSKAVAAVQAVDALGLDLPEATRQRLLQDLGVNQEVRGYSAEELAQAQREIQAQAQAPSRYAALGAGHEETVRKYESFLERVASDVGADGKTIRGSKQKKIIQEIQSYPGLTREQRSALYRMEYSSDANNPWA